MWGSVTLDKNHEFTGVFGVSKNNVYTVSYQSTIHHFDGVEWSLMNFNGSDLFFKGVYVITD